MAHLNTTGLSRTAGLLLVLIGVYQPAPFVELPVFGLSLSAPLFALLALEWGFASALEPIRRRWIVLPLLYWVGCAASLAVGLWSGRLSGLVGSELLLLIRSCYWCLVFVVVASVVSRLRRPENLAGWLAVGVGLAALLRLVELIALGHTDAKWLSPNDYGMSFSTFTPFSAWAAFALPGRGRWMALAALPLVLVAVAVNGSRSSWAGVLLGLVLLTVLFLASKPRGGARLALPLAAAGAAVLLLMAVPGWGAGLSERWGTLSHLDRDKPFQMRLLLVEKGQRLFETHPLFGVGLGRFTKERPTIETSRTPWATFDEIHSRSPHNAYFKVLAETGLAGTLPLAALLLALFVSGLPAALALARGGETWALAALASLAAMCLHLWTLSGLTNTAPWFVFGLVAAVAERVRRP